MNDAPNDPYRPFGQPEEPGTPGEETGPLWGSAAADEPSAPSYPPYIPPQAHPPAPQGYPPTYGARPVYPPSPYPYGQAAPPHYGLDNYGGHYSDKSKTTAGLLQLLLPFVFVCGVGRLYAGHTAVGVLQLILYFAGFVFFPIAIGIWLWSVIDGIVMLASSNFRDGQGRLMR